MFTVRTRVPGGLARTGTLHLAHGDVRTPAFVPLATKGAVKTLEPRDVAALGYELILGNTFHLLLAPGPDRVARVRRPPRVHALGRAIITDSGGFQVFSMGHGGVADEIKGRGRGGGAGLGSSDGATGAILSIDEEGVRFRSYVDGRERFLSPETSMSVQAALGSDIALVFDECTPFHVTREYTERSMERTHRWLERCLRWHAAARVRRTGRVRDRPGRRRAGPADRVGRGRRRERLRRDRDRRLARPGQGADALGRRLDHRRARTRGAGAAPPPARDRRRRRPDRRGRDGDRHVRLRAADPARAPRGRARARSGRRAGASTWPRAAGATRATRSSTAVPVPRAQAASRARTCTTCFAPASSPPCGSSRMHNLSFVARLMGDLRSAIDGGRLAEVAAALRGGAAPGAVPAAAPVG